MHPFPPLACLHLIWLVAFTSGGAIFEIIISGHARESIHVDEVDVIVVVDVVFDRSGVLSSLARFSLFPHCR